MRLDHDSRPKAFSFFYVFSGLQQILNPSASYPRAIQDNQFLNVDDIMP